MWHSPVACCSSQKFGLTHYVQSSLLINKDTMVVKKYSPASWSNIIELQDPATCQENVNYVSTSPKISPEFGFSCMMTMVIMVVVVQQENRTSQLFLCNSITQALAHVTKLFPVDTGRRPARQFLISQLGTSYKIFVTWVPWGFGHERAPGNLIWNGYLYPILIGSARST